MLIEQKIAQIRKKKGLTQDEFATKLHVTRQAVSRWENGETTPSIETLRAIAVLFEVDANEILGIDPLLCQSCASHMGIDTLGTNEDKSASVDYCCHCLKEGVFTYELTFDEFMAEWNEEYLKMFNDDNGTNYDLEEGRVAFGAILKTLKRWKKEKNKMKKQIEKYWEDMIVAIKNQDGDKISQHFIKDAIYKWRGADGMLDMTVADLVAGCLSYKDTSDGFYKIEQIEEMANGSWLAVVSSAIQGEPYFVTAIYKFKGDKIADLIEYYGDIM